MRLNYLWPFENRRLLYACIPGLALCLLAFLTEGVCFFATQLWLFVLILLQCLQFKSIQLNTAKTVYMYNGGIFVRETLKEK